MQSLESAVVAAGGVASPATQEALEFPVLLALVANLCTTDLGAARIRSLVPAVCLDDLGERRRLFGEVESLLADGALIPSQEEPISPLLASLRDPQSSVSGVDLNFLGDLLGISESLRERLEEARDEYPLLELRAAALPELGEFRRRIRSTLDRQGRVRDNASPRLTALRRQIREVRGSLYEELKKCVERDRDCLSEETTPMQEGRVVLLLQAGARRRIKGLVHGSSATGKSLYFEPLEAVEANNKLQGAVQEEREEKRRILLELTVSARDSLDAIERHAVLLSEVDQYQASCRFGEISRGRQADLADRGGLRLEGALHPLLHPLLADLREVVLGTPGHSGEVVPLDFELSPERRVLVVTGPNAGGKTVALKTVGLLSLAFQSGLPIPVDAGTALPLFDGIIASVGDEQDLLADRSTFSARLLRLKEAWDSGGGSLVLLDEVGSGTDPEEGSALAIALLDRLRQRDLLAVMTTHLSRLAVAAVERDGTGCAAMEFDAASGGPTYRLLPGPPGGSEALALARRLGLAKEWLEAAEALLGSEHRDVRRLLGELEDTRRELVASRVRAEAELAAVTEERSALRREREELAEARQEEAVRTREELDEFRQRVRRRLRQEVDKLPAAVGTSRSRKIVSDITAKLFMDAPELADNGAARNIVLSPGDRVRHRSLGWEGIVERCGENAVEVAVRGKRVHSRSNELELRDPADVGDRRFPPVSLPQRSSDSVPRELSLRKKRVEPALEELDAYLDQAMLAGRAEVRVIHGHGSGAMRQAVRKALGKHPGVGSFRPGGPGEGGDGVTIAKLKG